mmetsp:Transcript_42958/g.103494  ORF Transcript_42958/g.103494 Transcript_42958/m.103494 type:complete len:326 (-) Transcript_42958:3338-4315(-)
MLVKGRAESILHLATFSHWTTDDGDLEFRIREPPGRTNCRGKPNNCQYIQMNFHLFLQPQICHGHAQSLGLSSEMPLCIVLHHIGCFALVHRFDRDAAFQQSDNAFFVTEVCVQVERVLNFLLLEPILGVNLRLVVCESSVLAPQPQNKSTFLHANRQVHPIFLISCSSQTIPLFLNSLFVPSMNPELFAVLLHVHLGICFAILQRFGPSLDTGLANVEATFHRLSQIQVGNPNHHLLISTNVLNNKQWFSHDTPLVDVSRRSPLDLALQSFRSLDGDDHVKLAMVLSCFVLRLGGLVKLSCGRLHPGLLETFLFVLVELNQQPR